MIFAAGVIVMPSFTASCRSRRAPRDSDQPGSWAIVSQVAICGMHTAMYASQLSWGGFSAGFSTWYPRARKRAASALNAG